ncbi:alpha/beta fold hydrolase [Nodosilinea sp. LEGE 07088]|uniref:alpha/beta fold hydrolase n=1 Tax=Nodosilinea sp. LEGE 07088 TaxID=2777968 RepID=UPI001882F178|nr:alpha/beta fold hydrolase [Nodosilinea sp. LEGE 07088]MBE9136804.1 alpha/beta fold hydrolase [Nodosilinea sp. LEGE 07088]
MSATAFVPQPTVSMPSAHRIWRDQAIHYVVAGEVQDDRPPLLLVHGFGASTDHWRKNIQGLQADFQVWAIDLLGFGRSAKPDWQYSGDLWQAQLHEFITEVIGRPAVLAGNSLGGYAALCVAANHPESAAGLVLLNSAGPFSSPTQTPPPRPNPIAKAIQSLMLQPLPSWLLFQYVRQPATIRRTLQQVYLDKSAITDQLIEDIRRPSGDPGAAKVFASVFKSRQGEKVDELLQKLACPLLMLWGEGDPWMNCREQGAQFRQHYPTLTEHYLQAGHCPHDEVPDQVNGLLRDWVLEQVS